jgi:prevent-host-death family protein
MVEVGVSEARAALSRLLKLVEQGDEVLITRSGEPVARLVPVERQEPAREEPAREEPARIIDVRDALFRRPRAVENIDLFA